MSKVALPVPQLVSADPAVSRNQAQLRSALQPALAFPDQHATELTATFTAGQTQTLAHRLGREYSGWYVIDAQGAAAALFVPAGATNKGQVLTLTSTNAGTYKIRVF